MWKRQTTIAVSAIVIAVLLIAIYFAVRGRLPFAKEETSDWRHLKKYYPIPNDFNSTEIKSLKRQALIGDRKAADRLREMYSNCLGHYLIPNAPRPSVSETECKQELYHWVNIAAVNGSPSGIMQQYNFQSESDDCRDVYRARYWLSKIPQQHLLKEPWISEAKRQAQREKACGW